MEKITMPLDHGYGVLVGTIRNYYRDPPNRYGQYYHGNLILSAPVAQYHCAIDVDSHQSSVGVEWRTFVLRASDLSPVLNLGQGYHVLAPTSTSGALDYIRSSVFALRVGCLQALLRFIGLDYSIRSTWKRGTSIQALMDLEPLVNTTRAAGLLAFIFGEPFTTGLGMHNIHQNQGDPAGSGWWEENGIWQDGCTILQQDTDHYVAFMNKFTSQSYTTDSQGHPA
jgi:hypothetical protein